MRIVNPARGRRPERLLATTMGIGCARIDLTEPVAMCSRIAEELRHWTLG